MIREDDSDNDGPVLYRDDDCGISDENRMAIKIARKESLSLKLSLRPDRQELINRNILQLQSENERQESKEAIGAKLIRRLSMRPTQEELVERNILKSEYKSSNCLIYCLKVPVFLVEINKYKTSCKKIQFENR